ncbi:MAG: hypothetical protein WAN46_09570 [Gammaproteobacteria bacterium]|jgi:hypothetical protein
MISLQDQAKHVSLKIARAKKHLQELERELQIFFERKPFKVGVKINAQSRKPIYYVKRAEYVPDCISLIAADVIQNLVTTLDHLAIS